METATAGWGLHRTLHWRSSLWFAHVHSDRRGMLPATAKLHCLRSASPWTTALVLTSSCMVKLFLCAFQNRLDNFTFRKYCADCFVHFVLQRVGSAEHLTASYLRHLHHQLCKAEEKTFCFRFWFFCYLYFFRSLVMMFRFTLMRLPILPLIPQTNP